MTTQIFVNLPVKDPDQSVKFFTQFGYKFNPQFTDDKATCMIVADNIFVMLLVEDFFKTFTNKPLSDATKSTEGLVCVSQDRCAGGEGDSRRRYSANEAAGPWLHVPTRP